MFTQAGLKWYLTSFQQFVYFYLNNLNNTNAEQDSQGLCLKEREGESLASLALVGRTLHICIIIVDNLCVHYFNYCNLPSLHIIINGAAFSELNWHQFMRPLAGEGHTVRRTVRSLLCPLATSFTQSLLIWITALAILCRLPSAPLDCGIPLAQFGNYVQNPSDATRPATWRRLHNVLNCATFASCVYYDDGDGNGNGDGDGDGDSDSDSESSPARSCCSDSVHCAWIFMPDFAIFARHKI